MSEHRTRPSLVLAAGAVALAVGLAGCGGSSGTSASAPTTGAPAAATSRTVDAALTRVAAATKGKSSVSGTIATTSSTAGSISGTFAYRSGPTGVLAAFSFDARSQTYSGVATPTAVYISGAGLPLPGGKKYLRIPLTGTSEVAKTYTALTQGFTKAGDVESSVDQWRSIPDLKEVGTEKVDGVTATKYTGSVDPAKPPAGASKAVQNAYALAARAGVTSVQTSIWIGPDGLPLKVVSTSTGGASGTTTSVITYTGWGDPVDVKVPAADTVTTLPGS